MATETMASILTGLEAIDEKKANLRKALADLHAASSSLPTTSSSPSFANLKWDDMDAYFTSLQSHLRRKFALLETPKSDPPPVAPPVAVPVEPEPVLKRPELKTISEKMDAVGLRDYLLDRPKERKEIRLELPGAWKHAPDPGRLVLDAMQGVSGLGPVTDIAGLWRVAVVLLEALMEAKVEISPEVKEKALALGVEWRRKLLAAASAAGNGGGVAVGDGLERLCFLHLLAAFGLAESELFDMDELVGYAVEIARHRQATDVCRAIGFGDRISDVIQKLIDQGKQTVAVKFIFQFELTDKFPPVPMLRSYALETKKVGQRARQSGKNFRVSYNEEAAKAISAIKSVIKIIDEYNLESQLPKDEYVKRIEKLEQKKSSKKRNAANSGQPPAKQQKQGIGNKGRKLGPADAEAFRWQRNAANSTHHPIEHAQPRVQMAGFPADPYQAYGLRGSAPSVTPYVGTSGDIYGVSRTHTSYSGEVDPSGASLYPLEPVVRPDYCDRPVAYSGYSYPPEYHPPFYPQ